MSAAARKHITAPAASSEMGSSGFQSSGSEHYLYLTHFHTSSESKDTGTYNAGKFIARFYGTIPF